MRKALFLPSYLGGGFGHISRCLVVAGELRRRGWDTAFAFSGQHVSRVEKGGHRVYRLRRPFQPRPEKGPGPAFTIFSEFNYQLVRDGLTRPAVIKACQSEQMKIIHRFKPDVLIADSWPLARVLAHFASLPLVQVIRSIIHPAAPRLIWWQEPPSELVPPDLRPIFNPLMASWGLPDIRRGEDLLTGDLYLVPSIPELDPLPEQSSNTIYVGPLTRSPQESGTPPGYLADLEPEKPVIYVTIGGGAGTVGGIEFYQLLFQALGDCDLQVVASTGARFSPKDLPNPPVNMHLESWVPGPAVITRSDLVIYPGGYGTTMELVQAGVPGLAIPFHTEQESNSRRMEAAGLGRVLLPSRAKAVPIWYDWPGGRFCTLVQSRIDLAPADLREAILNILADGSSREDANRLKAEAGRYGGPSLAVDLIEKL